MSDPVNFDLQGIDELKKKLNVLSEDLQLKGGRFALRKAANVLRDRVKANARRLDDPETARSIEQNIAVRWSGRYFKQTRSLKFRVGVMGGARQGGSGKGGDTFYWRFLEFGTRNVRARPFIRPAMASGRELVETFVTQYGRALDRAIKRAEKQ